MGRLFLIFLVAVTIQIILYTAEVAVNIKSIGNKNVPTTPKKLKRLLYFIGKLLINTKMDAIKTISITY